MTQKQLLQAALYAFNAIPNSRIDHHDFKDTYSLAAAISAKLDGRKYKVDEQQDDEEKVQPFTCQVFSSHGEWTISVTNGKVLKHVRYDETDVDSEFIPEIDHFDVDEYNKFWNDSLKEGYRIDILNLGYWLKNGTYEEPENDWRQDLIERRAAEVN